MSSNLLNALRDANPETRRRACVRAPGSPDPAVLVTALGAALDDPERGVARAAADALAALAEHAARAQVGDRARGALRTGLAAKTPGARFAAACCTPIVRAQMPLP